MRSTLAMTVAALAAAAAASMAGCARPGDAAAAGPLDGEAMYQQISDTIFGTPQDRLAAEARLAAQVQQGIAGCMAKSGFSYTPAPSEKQAGGPQTPGDLTSLAPIGAADFGIAQAKRGAAEAVDQLTNPGFTTLSGERRAAYGTALTGCGSEIGSPEPFRPKDAIAMTGELEDMFTAIEARPEMAAKLADYGTCLARAGFEAKDYASLYTLVQDHFPDPGAGWKTISTTSKWADAVSFEQRAAAADATCRSDLRTTAMALAAPQLQQFLTDHGTQLAAADQQWSQQARN